MKTFTVKKIGDECTVTQKYEILVNNSFYISNISKDFLKQEIDRLLNRGFLLVK